MKVLDMSLKFGDVAPSLEMVNLDDKKKPNELQKAVVAFDCRGGGKVLAYQGDCLEGEIDALGYDADELGITDKTSPDSGIWIWEGHFRYYRDWDGEWDCSTSTERWRKLTNVELQSVAEGDFSFDVIKHPELCQKCNSEVVKNCCVSCGFSP